MALRDYNDGD